MKKIIYLLMVCLFSIATVSAQKWSELTDEQKVMKAKEFRADNQKYLKSLGMTPTQMEDIDNINLCYLSTLDRINRYGKDEANKEKYAEAVTESRHAQLDIIMGPEKHKQYMNYIKAKLEKVQQ